MDPTIFTFDLTNLNNVTLGGDYFVRTNYANYDPGPGGAPDPLRVLEIDNDLPGPGLASFGFTGTTGNYQITATYIDESDGNGTLELFSGPNNLLGQVKQNCQHGHVQKNHEADAFTLFQLNC